MITGRAEALKPTTKKGSRDYDPSNCSWSTRRTYQKFHNLVGQVWLATRRPCTAWRGGEVQEDQVVGGTLVAQTLTFSRKVRCL